MPPGTIFAQMHKSLVSKGTLKSESLARSNHSNSETRVEKLKGFNAQALRCTLAKLDVSIPVSSQLVHGF